MNHFFFEVRGKERVRELRNEGLVNQAIHRNQADKPKIIKAIWGGVSAILRLVVRNSKAEKKTSGKSRTSNPITR